MRPCVEDSVVAGGWRGGVGAGGDVDQADLGGVLGEAVAAELHDGGEACQLLPATSSTCDLNPRPLS
jgi:hypothetical protein